LPVDDASITRAAGLLRDGKLVAFPTETVYGLGGDATNGHAVAAIYAAKGRPSFNPLIIHVAEMQALDHLVEWNDTARLLATSLWPGPLTLILPRRKDAPISLLASAGLDTLAVRIPSHPAAQKLLRAVGVPVAAPSANASGKLSPTAPAHVAESLGDKVDMILAAGRTAIGIESTVVNLATAHPTILRPGGVTREQITRILGTPVAIHESSADGTDAPASPGMLASHYAPYLPIRLNVESADVTEAYLGFGANMIKSAAAYLNLSPSGDLNEAAANLFAMLRELDKPDFTAIAVAPIPQNGLGAAINDRLRRAAT
jgi:L-threonylcarbamoyladenylate synthase